VISGGGSKTGVRGTTGIGDILAGSVDRLGPTLRLGSGQASPSKELSAEGTTPVPSAGAGSGSDAGVGGSTTISGSGAMTGIGVGSSGGGGATTGADTGGVGSCI